MRGIFFILTSQANTGQTVPPLLSLSLCGQEVSLACLLTPDAQQKAENMPEVKDYSFWSFSSLQNLPFSFYRRTSLPCTFLKSTSSHVRPI